MCLTDTEAKGEEIATPESMTHSSTSYLGKFPISRMRSYRTPLPTILAKHRPPPSNGPKPPMPHMRGTHILCVGKYGLAKPLGGANFPQLFGMSVCWTHIGTTCGRYGFVSITFSNRPDETMSVWIWQKLV